MKIRIESACELHYKIEDKYKNTIELAKRIDRFKKLEKEIVEIEKTGVKSELRESHDEENIYLATKIRSILNIDNIVGFSANLESNFITVYVFGKHESLTVGGTYSVGHDKEGCFIEVL